MRKNNDVTFLEQALKQVHEDDRNKDCFDQIEDLLRSIAVGEFDDLDTKRWHTSGVIVTGRDLSKEKKNSDWVYVETDAVQEYSWLIEELLAIYKPKKTEYYRLLTTIGFLLNIYGERFDDLTEILSVTTVVSAVFLHPDHAGRAVFRIHPIKLPTFGKEF